MNDRDLQLQESNKVLDRVQASLVEMTGLVQVAISDATKALLTADTQLAEEVISADHKIDAINNTIENICIEVLTGSTHPNVEVRITIACLRMATTLERMGDLAAHVAKQARLRYPEVSVPVELHDTFARMGELANQVIERAGRVISTEDLNLAADIVASDNEMDDIHRDLFTTVLSPDWQHGVQAAIDVTLLSRYYERFGDHALSVARRIVFVVKGEPYGVSQLEAAADSE